MLKLTVQVCGDPTVDWLTIKEEAEPGLGPFFWMPSQSASTVGVSSQPGGAALITKFLKTMIPPAESDIQGVELDQEFLETPFSLIDRSSTVWQLKGKHGESASFRIAEWVWREPGNWDYAKHKQNGRCELLVVEDSGLGFRGCEAGWPEVLSQNGEMRPEHVIAKLALYADGKCPATLRRILSLGLGDRTTILTAIGDLRTCSVAVSESLSWERMMEQVVSAVYSRACPFVEKDGRLAFARVIVTIGTAGAVIVDREHNTLVFDRSGQEGDFERRYSGQMIGYNTCVLGALAAHWVTTHENGSSDHPVLSGPDWTQATVDGVGLARLLHLGGYSIQKGAPRDRLQFPFAELAKAYRTRRVPSGPPETQSKEIWDLGVFAESHDGLSKTRPGHWTILQQVLTKQNGNTGIDSVADRVGGRAKTIAVSGPNSALPEVPVETIGKWRSADRNEIEDVRTFQNAMKEYLNRKRPDTPLAVAVFGPPGAGKSFAVKQVADELGIKEDSQLTFNLSQFESPAELARAFHLIRDLNLSGKTPLVFWDEFDSRSGGQALGWLRYFLAPIQDGRFSEAGVSHPVGGGIYVFAGGTCRSFEEFAAVNPGPDGKEDREAKKPDFASRMRAYINIKGPNGDPNMVTDELSVIRRAFLLHALLWKHAKQLRNNGQFQVGYGVLDAFLKTIRYRHGARSMESIVTMSSLQGRGIYEVSSLPPEHLLKMHVDAEDFLGLTRLGHREILRVGVAGHIGLDPARDAELDGGIAKAVSLIEKSYPNRYLTVLSALAGGTDRIVARKLLGAAGSRLIAVLPLPIEDYLLDFGTSDVPSEDPAGAELRREFRYWLNTRAVEVIVMPTSATRNQAYEKAGRYIVEHCDVMIFVWDGKPAQGRGGTADMVEYAVHLNKPICHVWAGNYKTDATKQTDVGGLYGQLRMRNFSGCPQGDWCNAEDKTRELG